MIGDVVNGFWVLIGMDIVKELRMLSEEVVE